MSELDDRLELAVAIALEASAIPRQHFFDKELVVERKADDSPVTRADTDTEVLLRNRIEAACPSDSISGEEFPTKEGTTGFKWHLDPIDGTQSFIRGVPLFGMMVALQHGDEAVMGVIAFPALGEIIYAAKGSGAWWATNADEAKGIQDLDRRAAKVSTTTDLADAALAYGGLELFAQLGMNDETLSSSTGAQKAIAAIDLAIQTINTQRGTLGATQNRLEMTISNIGSMRENLQAADSRIRDVDVAEETAAMSCNQILSQAGTSVLAQANQLPQSALSLIGG